MTAEQHISTRHNTDKLHEALADLQAQRNVLDTAISQIQATISWLDGANRTVVCDAIQHSYVDDTITCLKRAGRPIHINDLRRLIGEIRGAVISRASLESSLIRHINNVKGARVVKVRPSTFALPAWAAPARHPSDDSAASPRPDQPTGGGKQA